MWIGSSMATSSPLSAPTCACGGERSKTRSEEFGVMSRMIDLIRASALPSNLMQSAAKGSLSVPPPETIEILVYLAVHNKVFGQQAQLTLAGWDEASSRVAASESSTPKEVLDYLISPKNLRPVLLPALLGNPSVSEESLVES